MVMMSFIGLLLIGAMANRLYVLQKIPFWVNSL